MTRTATVPVEISQFLNTVLNRANTPMEPVSYKVNWGDAPLHHKVYADAPRRVLPPPFATLGDEPASSCLERLVDAPLLSRAHEQLLSDLLMCYGQLDRRAELNWNEDALRKLSATDALWGRPTASGGGMYPLEQYLVAGRGSTFPVGTGHYSSAAHGLDILDHADRTDALARATGTSSASYLVVTCRFWKNSFKYNTFCYHVVSQDLGCLLGSWRAVAAAHGLRLNPLYNVDDDLICAELGLDGLHEAPYAVLALEPRPAAAAPVAVAPERRVGPRGGENGHAVLEASRTTRTFPLVDKAHAACFMEGCERPPVETVRPTETPAGPVIDLPRVRGGLSTEQMLRERRSGFGAFCRRTGMTVEQLSTGLRMVALMAREPHDLAPLPREPWVGQWAIVAGVVGLADGAYRYLDDTHQLVRAGTQQLRELQRFYPLTNYSLGEVSVVHVMTARLASLIAQAGARGMRTTNVEIGQAGQAMYLAAAAFGFGAGAVLGLDNLEIDKFLGIDRSGEQSLLCHLLGAHRPTQSRAVLPLHSHGGAQ